jgi:hypothetical protein
MWHDPHTHMSIGRSVPKRVHNSEPFPHQPQLETKYTQNHFYGYSVARLYSTHDRNIQYVYQSHSLFTYCNATCSAWIAG